MVRRHAALGLLEWEQIAALGLEGGIEETLEVAVVKHEAGRDVLSVDADPGGRDEQLRVLGAQLDEDAPEPETLRDPGADRLQHGGRRDRLGQLRGDAQQLLEPTPVCGRVGRVLGALHRPRRVADDERQHLEVLVGRAQAAVRRADVEDAEHAAFHASGPSVMTASSSTIRLPDCCSQSMSPS